jgi:hypothetical protein
MLARTGLEVSPGSMPRTWAAQTLMTPPWQKTATSPPGMGGDDLLHAVDDHLLELSHSHAVAAGGHAPARPRKFSFSSSSVADVDAGIAVELHDARMPPGFRCPTRPAKASAVCTARSMVEDQAGVDGSPGPARRRPGAPRSRPTSFRWGSEVVSMGWWRPGRTRISSDGVSPFMGLAAPACWIQSRRPPAARWRQGSRPRARPPGRWATTSWAIRYGRADHEVLFAEVDQQDRRARRRTASASTVPGASATVTPDFSARAERGLDLGLEAVRQGEGEARWARRSGSPGPGRGPRPAVRRPSGPFPPAVS